LLRRWSAIALLVAGTVGCDRLTKYVATQKLAGLPAQSYLADTLRLGYAENTGGFLSLGADLSAPVRTLIFSVATGGLLALLMAAVWHNGWDRWRTVALSLFIAGGASNWTSCNRDRDFPIPECLNAGHLLSRAEEVICEGVWSLPSFF
jgi:signal peptidase II